MESSLPAVRRTSTTEKSQADNLVGSFSLFPEKPLRELLDLAHEHGAYVSTVGAIFELDLGASSLICIGQGGWAEHLLTHHDAPNVIEKYLAKCKDLG